MSPQEISRSLAKVANVITPGSITTIEGVPLYAGQPWSDSHDFGTNLVLPELKRLLEERSCRVTHWEMVDDFTTGIWEDTHLFTERMNDNPTHIFYESEFAQQAEEIAHDLQRRGKTIQVQGEILLAQGRMPRIRTRSGRISCELLDACFQCQKSGDTHVIVHPKMFSHQQEGMREILREISGGQLPASLLNIFFKNDSISTVLFTDRHGRGKHI